MEITYLGHSCFKLKSKDGDVLIIDPFLSSYVGLPLAKDVADVVVVSHDHQDHNQSSLITGPVKRNETFLIDKEGEYEIGGNEFLTIKTYHDKVEGKERGKNLITEIRMDGVNVVHLGDLGHKLTEGTIEKLGSVDVLLVGVGGKAALPMDEVFELIKDIQPSIVVPMHNKVAGMSSDFDDLPTLEEFLEKNKFPVAAERQHKIKVDVNSLPDDIQVQLMNG